MLLAPAPLALTQVHQCCLQGCVVRTLLQRWNGQSKRLDDLLAVQGPCTPAEERWSVYHRVGGQLRVLWLLALELSVVAVVEALLLARQKGLLPLHVLDAMFLVASSYRGASHLQVRTASLLATLGEW